MARCPDWHARLAALLAAAETRPFHAHRWNCGRFAIAAIHAAIGRRPAWRSLPTLEATADSAGFPRIPPVFARAGDVVLAGDPPRLGMVVGGGRAAFVGPRGLVRISLTDCTAAWRID
jgi:hypothetical protein